MNPAFALAHIIDPALDAIGLNSRHARALLLGTMIVESGGVFVRQHGGGPALGLWQMEPTTHADIFRHFLGYRGPLAHAVRALDWTDGEQAIELVHNHWLACALARCLYRRFPDRLPEPGDVAGQAVLWKRLYNTRLGQGTEAKYIAKVSKWNYLVG